MMEVGLRELRQNASDYVRRVESGESFVVTVSGRPAARLVPTEGRTWRRFEEISDLLGRPPLAGLGPQLEALDHSLVDPFSR